MKNLNRITFLFLFCVGSIQGMALMNEFPIISSIQFLVAFVCLGVWFEISNSARLNDAKDELIETMRQRIELLDSLNERILARNN